MNIDDGKGRDKYENGVQIDLTGDEVAIAIDAYLVSQRVHVSGPRIITVNGILIKTGRIYVDPEGFVIKR